MFWQAGGGIFDLGFRMFDFGFGLVGVMLSLSKHGGLGVDHQLCYR